MCAVIKFPPKEIHNYFPFVFHFFIWNQTTLLDLDALARHLADCIRRWALPTGISLGICIVFVVSGAELWHSFSPCICISSREILDHQDGNIEDDGLTGLLRLATSVIKHKPPFKFSREGQVRRILHDHWGDQNGTFFTTFWLQGSVYESMSYSSLRMMDKPTHIPILTSSTYSSFPFYVISG